MLLQKDRPVSHRGSNSFTQGYKRICFTRTIKMAHDRWRSCAARGKFLENVQNLNTLPRFN